MHKSSQELQPFWAGWLELSQQDFSTPISVLLFMEFLDLLFCGAVFKWI